jgi:putative transposase
VLDAHVFEDLDQVREITAGWIATYNERRPHESLGDLPPSTFRRAVETVESSTNSVRR